MSSDRNPRVKFLTCNYCEEKMLFVAVRSTVVDNWVKDMRSGTFTTITLANKMEVPE